MRASRPRSDKTRLNLLGNMFKAQKLHQLGAESGIRHQLGDGNYLYSFNFSSSSWKSLQRWLNFDFPSLINL